MKLVNRFQFWVDLSWWALPFAVEDSNTPPIHDGCDCYAVNVAPDIDMDLFQEQ